MEQYYSCKLDNLEQLKLYCDDSIRWLNMPNDFTLIREYYKLFADNDIKEADFSEKQWKFCALFKNNKIVSYAGVLYMTEKNWELGAVSTHPQYRNKGYSTMVCYFVQNLY
jgi:predicted GNAT family acetyltransferase